MFLSESGLIEQFACGAANGTFREVPVVSKGSRWRLDIVKIWTDESSTDWLRHKQEDPAHVGDW